MREIDELVARLSAPRVDVGDLDEGDARRVVAERVGALFTDCVDLLRRTAPDSDVREMVGHAWEVIGGRHVLVAVGLPVEVVTFSIVSRQGAWESTIHLPLRWVEMFEERPLFHLGAIVYTCSKAVDAYHLNLDRIEERARAYEGAFLRGVGLLEPDDYQREVMASPPVEQFAYPRGAVVPRS